MRRSQLLRTRWALSVLSISVVMAVAFLPVRDVGIGNPFHLGVHLSQMGLSAFMVGLVILALAATLLGFIVDRGEWPARLIAVSGFGIVVLSFLIQQAAATGVFIPSSSHIHLGDAVAILAGALIALVGAMSGYLRTRTSGGDTVVSPW